MWLHRMTLIYDFAEMIKVVNLVHVDADVDSSWETPTIQRCPGLPKEKGRSNEEEIELSKNNYAVEFVRITPYV
jgi:hypothetical protein